MYELLKLPFEVQCIILGFLSIEDLKTISLVDKSIFKFVTDVSSRRFQLKVDYNNFAMLKRRRKLLRDYASLKLVATSRIFNHLVPPKFCNLLTNLQHLELNFEDDLWSHKKCSVNLFKFLHQLPSIKSLKWDSIEEIPEVTGSFIKENCCSFNLDQLVLSNMDSQKILDIFPESSKLKKLAINCDCHFEQVQYEAVLIEFLSRQSLLNNLELSWIELNDGFFKELPLNLVSLKLDHCSFREHDQFCKFLKEQRFMESLALKQCKGLNNEILQTICELVTLKHLKIDLCNGFEVVNSNDCQFWKLGNLISLNVSNHPTAIGDLFANLFSGAENLSMRNLQFQYVDCKMLDLTTKFPYLSTLELREIKISNEDLNCILKNLKYLYKLFLELPSNELTDDFKTDAQLTDLRHLTISNSHSSLTDKFIQQFLQVCPNLQSLNFEFCEKFDFRWIILTFQNLKSLKDLQLSKRFLNHEELKAGKLIETIEDLKNDDFECLILDLQLYNYAFNYLKGISYKVLCRNKN